MKNQPPASASSWSHDKLSLLAEAAGALGESSSRDQFLNRVCQGNPALRDAVEAKIAALANSCRNPESSDGARAGDDTAGATLVDAAEFPEPASGQRIGRYKLLEKVGEGGCGVVYVAEQTEPVRRRVALKVIKLGMDTKAVVARFEAERQALAMMDHPNIARALDAGSTEQGRPYFVMELVRGIQITEYCDQAQLSTKARLELFIKVCHAIQHAHQKGIIHRDIKPSNILVTLHDGVPIPKIIDFGIAKATEGRLAEATVYTQLHQFIGTPAYMSPEQAEMSGLDIDTRSDIYSLGVLLYELMTGRTPFDAQELASQGLDAMRKTIREREPERPSTRLAALERSDLTTTAKRRGAEALKLAQLLKGDLDWIAMKCLEKDRARRYETAAALAADIDRHLNNEPVLARPASAVYKLQKAFRRNKLIWSAGAVVALSLVIGLGAATTAYLGERKALRALIQSEQKASIQRARYAVLSGDELRTEQALKEAAEKGVPESAVKMLRGQLLLTTGRAEQAAPELREVLAAEPGNVAALGLLASACITGTTWQDYELLAPRLMTAKPATPEDYLFLGWARSWQEPAAGIALMEQAIQMEDSPMARVVLAIARNQFARETRNKEAIEASLSDLKAVTAWTKQSILALAATLEAHVIAGQIFHRLGDEKHSQEAFVAAELDGKRIESFYPNRTALGARLLQLLASGKYGEAMAKSKAWAEELKDSNIAFAHMVELLRARQYQAAVDWIATFPHEDPLLDLTNYLACLKVPGREAERERLWNKLMHLDEKADLARLYVLTCAALLDGKLAEAQKAARQVSIDSAAKLGGLRPHYKQLVDYLKGSISEEELLLASKDSLSAQCEAQHFIGLRKFAAGDKAAARQRWQASVDTDQLSYLASILSEILLKLEPEG
jgi:serine/threonine protein kinase